jgi:hypothetical protein
LGLARKAALDFALFGKTEGDVQASPSPALGLDPGQFKTGWEFADIDGGRVTYDKPDDDTNGPVLKVSSTPRKGAKVKTGDQIKVTIGASERYSDGHKLAQRCAVVAPHPRRRAGRTRRRLRHVAAALRTPNPEGDVHGAVSSAAGRASDCAC